MNKILFSERFNQAIVDISQKTSNHCVDLILAINAALYVDLINDDHLKKMITMLDYRFENGDVLISYLAIGKEPEFTVNNKWSRKNRQQGKLGKTILNFLKPFCNILHFREPSSKELEDFVNLFKSHVLNNNYEFKLVKGNDIAHYYYEGNYQLTSNGGSTLFSSCMRHKECQKYFDIYTENEQCELLIMFDTHLSSTDIVGRAIVWNYEGKKYVDRRYTCLDLYESAMINYIESQKWNYKKHNTFDDDYNRIFNEYDFEKNKYILNKNRDIKISVKDTYSYYPYMDTVKYFDEENKLLTNNRNLVDNFIILCSADGYYEDNDEEEDGYYCDYCGEFIHYNDEYTLTNHPGAYYCDNCVVEDSFGEMRLYSEVIEVMGRYDIYYIHEDADISEYAVLFEGTWYAIPGTDLEAHPSIKEFDLSEYTDEERSEFYKNHRVINDKYIFE